jgi:putative ABC transport system permease protein
MFAKIALLNIVKHAKRSVVVFVAVAIAVLVLTLVGGLVRGVVNTFLSSIVPTAGHVVVTKAASKDAPNPLDLKYLLPEADGLLAKIHDDRISVAEPVLTFGSLVAQPTPADSKTESKNLRMLGQAVNPDTRFLSNIRGGITAGAFLPDGNGVALSNKAAAMLDLKLGDRVDLLFENRDGGPEQRELPITGLFSSGSDQTDLNIFVVSLATAREGLGTEGMSRELRLLVKDPDTAPDVAASIAKQLDDASLRVEPWQITFSSLLAVLQFVQIIFLLIRVFFIVIAGSVIVNSILMTVFERTREYGTLRAIGLKKLQLSAMIVTEGALLGALGAAAGLAAGIPFVIILSNVGLDMGNATESLGFASRIYPQFDTVDAAFSFAFGVLIAVLASLYAARVSSRLSVTEALTHV